MRKKQFLRQKFRENWKFPFSQKLSIRSIQMRYQMKVLEYIFLFMPIIKGKNWKNSILTKNWLWWCKKFKTWFFSTCQILNFFRLLWSYLVLKNFLISIVIKWKQNQDQWRKFGPPSPPMGGDGGQILKNSSNGPILMKFRTHVRFSGPFTDTRKFLSPHPPIPPGGGRG